MPFTETITIINNSGKIVKTGKHLLGIFKEAKASYQEKKDAIRAERGLQRAQTFDVSARSPPLYDTRDDYYLDQPQQHHHHRRRIDDGSGRSYVSSSSRRSHGSSRRSRSVHRSGRARPALTETNLRTLSEVSSVPPSAAAPQNYRSPYAETAPRDMALSRPTLLMRGGGAPTEAWTEAMPPPPPQQQQRQHMTLQRAYSDPDIAPSRAAGKEIDMNLAYGNVPPDLASRADLDPGHKEEEAQGLVERVEGLLDEAHCLHHTATAIIAHLQGNPEAAAAVALTLAELSTLLTKMSPAFLSVIKGASPAVFALLASPQFLIGAGVAVGVTIVMFGGWKIIKRIKEEKAAREAMTAQAMAFGPVGAPGGGGEFPGRVAGPPSDGVDEALVLEEELSTIETWRRGIVPAFGDEGTADLELISPEADRAMRQRRKDRERDRNRELGPDDSVSRVGMSTRSERSAASGRSGKSHKSRSRREEIPERKSSRAGTHHGRERDRDGGSSVAGSERSSRSKRTERVHVKAIEASRVGEGENELDLVLRPKDRKGSMLKTLFKKKKEKEEQKVAA